MTWADVGAFLVGLVKAAIEAAKGTPAPPIADTRQPDGMTAQERAAMQQALADADAARAKVNAPAAKGVQ